jgi:GT2 family glycosyltransferase
VVGSTPALSLVVSTIGRPAMLTRLVRSLAVEAATADFELIVVDQSESGSARAVVAEHATGFAWQVLTSERGVSLGRNRGLAQATAPIVAFPDDDCWFPGSTLAAIVAAFAAQPDLAGVTAMLWDAEGRPNMLRWSSAATAVTRRNYYRTSIGSTMFVRTAAARTIGGFDEHVGPGSGTALGSCEDADFLLRVMDTGTVVYRPDLGVHHDAMQATLEASVAEKMYTYGAGQAWLWRRHRYPRTQVGYLLARKAAKVTLWTVRGHRDDAASDRAFLRGAVDGLVGRVPEARVRRGSARL